MLEFYRTQAGRTFIDATLPNIARELARLCDVLERIAAALEKPTGNDDDDEAGWKR
ncbi:MAG: hypothetical protein IT350_12590 [Deltaproteobacteria bacterium]|nr:hypothetical protein [Deltaproteobacteria bacterium]